MLRIWIRSSNHLAIKEMPSNHPKITLLVTPEQDAWLDSQTGPLKTKSVVVRDLIDMARQGLTGGLDYAPTVSVRETQVTPATSQTEEPQSASAVWKESSAASGVAQTTVLPRSEQIKICSNFPPVSVGDGVGRESEGTPRKGGSWKKEVPPSLDCHSKLIFSFWEAKAGAKSKQAWSMLMTELGKIQQRYGDRPLREQLELAAASRWKSVTLKNYEQFGLPTPKQASGRPQAKSLTEQARELGLF